jgi:hypothetical protein
LKSVQDNVELLEYPDPFRDFLTYVSLIDGNVNTGLRRMANQEDNPYFSQWVDVLALAQNDRRMKYRHDFRRGRHERRASGAARGGYGHVRHLAGVFYCADPDFSTPIIFRVLMKPRI